MITTGLKIDDQAHVFHPWMRSYKSFRAEQSELLSIGNQNDEIIFERRPCPHRPHRFQNGGHSGGIVCRSRPAGDRIIVGHQHHCPGVGGARQASDNIARVRSYHKAIAFAHSNRSRNLGIHSQRYKLRENILPGIGIGAGANRMRCARDSTNVGHRPLRRKFILRRCSRQWSRRLQFIYCQSSQQNDEAPRHERRKKRR